MRRFLAQHRLPAPPEGDVRTALGSLADAAHADGVRALETFYSPGTGTAFTLVEAGDEDEVRRTYARAGLGEPEVMPAERIHTDLLDQPRRNR